MFDEAAGRGAAVRERGDDHVWRFCGRGDGASAVGRHDNGGLSLEGQRGELGGRVAVVEAGGRYGADFAAEQGEVGAGELPRLLHILADDGPQEAVLVHGDERRRGAQDVDDGDGVAPGLPEQLRYEGDFDLHRCDRTQAGAAESIARCQCGTN